jgi:plastocyanin
MKAQTTAIFLLLIFFSFRMAFGADEAQSQNAISPPADDVQKIEIVVDSYSFKPDHFTATAGKPVELTLRSVTSVVPHNFTIDDPESGLNVDVEIPAGKDVTVTLTPLKTGKFQFYCNKKGIFGSHRKKGMEGTMEVI